VESIHLNQVRARKRGTAANGTPAPDQDAAARPVPPQSTQSRRNIAPDRPQVWAMTRMAERLVPYFQPAPRQEEQAGPLVVSGGGTGRPGLDAVVIDTTLADDI
jgi:hypothetical protein